MAGLVDLLHGKALEGPQHQPQGSTVGKNRHGLPVVFLGNALQSGNIARQYAFHRLAALYVPLPHVPVEAVQLLRLRHGQLLPGVALPHADAHLAEGRCGVERQALWLVDGPGGGAGAEQVAGVHCVHMNIGKAVPERGDLLVAPLCDQAVIVSVGNAVEIALGLGVTDKIKPRHTTVTHSFSSDTAFSTAAGRSAAY